MHYHARSDQTCPLLAFNGPDDFSTKSLEDLAMIEEGRRVVISYPAPNHVLFPPAFAQRAITIYDVRDLVEKPLTLEEYLERPYIRRTRWLVRGVDECTGKWRNFYLGATREYEAPATVRIGLYEPLATRPYKILPKVFEPTRSDRRLLYQFARRIQHEAFGDLKPCLFSDDLKLFKAG